MHHVSRIQEATPQPRLLRQVSHGPLRRVESMMLGLGATVAASMVRAPLATRQDIPAAPKGATR